ncbi:MAG TPA: Nramp family divalent metal transporter [Casimicrobiaceae bacterium]|nr:Nramp family divalent metal transporter [Casimicrobiaceae bacterium]
MSPQQLTGTLAADLSGGRARRVFAYLGPATLVGVGYMDPGNWATDLEGGARFGYQLLWVLVVANLVALLLQTLSARLGIVTRLDLAQACRLAYPRPVVIVLWLLCEIAIVACDLAEVIGSAVALNLLFGWPLIVGAIVTALDVFALLALQRFGVRRLEAIVMVLVLTVGGCLAVEWWLADPSWRDLATGLNPRIDSASLYVAIGILGATVMPHNLYLHSYLVKTRVAPANQAQCRKALRYSFVDTLIALNIAFVINAALLVVASDVFHSIGLDVRDLREAQRLLTPLLGTGLAGLLFAVALLCAGQSSTITGTLAGQVVMQGFLKLKWKPITVRMVTRTLAIIPAIVVLALFGEESTVALLVATQVVLSIQLPFAMVPLIRFSSSRALMGAYASGWRVALLASIAALGILACNAWLVVQTLGDELPPAWLPIAGTLGVATLGLIVYLAVAPLRAQSAEFVRA